MAQDNIWLWIIGIAIIIALGMFIQKSYDIFAITGQETMTRTAPATVNPSSSFTVTYTAIGTSGLWGASIVDSVSGGCQFPAGTQIHTVMLSDEGTTKQITVTAPSSGSCTFTGDYMFGNESIKNFDSTTVTIGTCTPSCTGKVCGDNGCGGSCGTCQTGYTCSSGQCVSGGCTSGQTQACTASNTCSGTQTCTSGAWGTCTTSLTKCSDGSCKTDCGTVTPTTWCTFAEKLALFPITNTKCTDGSIILGILALLGIIFIGKLSK